MVRLFEAPSTAAENGRYFVHPSRSCASIGDWIWCTKCDTELVAYQELGREMCIHTGFLAIKSWRANQRSKMFVGEQQGLTLLTPNFNLDGTKADSTLARVKPEAQKRRKHAPPTSTQTAPLDADAQLDLLLEKHRKETETSEDRQRKATGEVLELEDKPGPEKLCQATQTAADAETSYGTEPGWTEYRTLLQDETIEDYGRFHRQLALNLFCPYIVEDGLPKVLHPQKVQAFGFDPRYGITQLTRDLIGTEKHEMVVFFQKFERALHTGKLDGSNPTVWEAWEALGRVLWGLPFDLYKYMRMDYDNVDMLMDMKTSLSDLLLD